MNKKAIKDLLSRDQLKEAIDLLLSQEVAVSNSLQSLKGRMVDLTKQNNQGTISSEAYNVERNRIRVALIDIINASEDDPLEKPTVNAKKILPLLGGALLLIAGFFIFNLSGLGKKKDGSNNPGKDKIAETVQHELRQRTIQFSTAAIPMGQNKSYAQVLAKMTRKYTWKVVIPVSVITANATVKQIPEAKKLVVTISEAKLLSNFSIDNKVSKTVSNNLWIEETSKDGTFWENINNVTRSKILVLFQKDKKFVKTIKSQSIQNVKKEVDKIMHSNGWQGATIEIVINKVTL